MASSRNDNTPDFVAGPFLTFDSLPPYTSLADRLGFAYHRKTDEHPVVSDAVADVVFVNDVKLRLPLWLFPVLYLTMVIRRRRKTASSNTKPLMNKPLLFAGLAGVLIGGTAVYFLTRPPSSNKTGALTAQATEVDPGKPPIGTWRVDLNPIIATYDFKPDGTFSLRFRNVSTPSTSPNTPHEASGTWSLTDKTLMLVNTYSTTPLVLVGETETATLLSASPASLLFEHEGRREKKEQLTFTAELPFIPGKTQYPNLPGAWRPPTMPAFQLNSDGTVIYNLAIATGGSNNRTSPRTGQWCQTQNKLILRLEPRSRTPDFEEITFTLIDFSSDTNSLTLQRDWPVPQPHIIYTRIPNPPPLPSSPSQRRSRK